MEPETDTSEEQFASEIGLPRKELAAIRKSDTYRQGHHWDKDGTKIIWLPLGKAQLREELGLKTAPKIGDRAAGRVINKYCPNQRMVFMVVDGEQQTVQCDPADKPHLKGHMIVPLQYKAAGWTVARSPRI